MLRSSPSASALRWLVGAFVTAAYLLPGGMGVVTYAAHDLYHLRERLGETPHAESGDGATHAFVHQHGGAMHSHDAATDALLSASRHEESPSTQHATATIELVGHLPSRTSVVMVEPSRSAPLALEPSRGRAALPSAPPLPPPRV
jgi:hypothetical protein